MDGFQLLDAGIHQRYLDNRDEIDHYLETSRARVREYICNPNINKKDLTIRLRQEKAGIFYTICEHGKFEMLSDSERQRLIIFYNRKFDELELLKNIMI